MALEEHFHWVTPTLAIGDFYASTPPACWHSFSVILNLCESQHEGLSPEYNEYLWLPFSDGDGRAFRKRLPIGLRFLKKNEHLKTLVHCMAGVSRSTALVLAFLCKHRSCESSEDIEQVFQEIQASRTCAFPAQAFVDVIADRQGVEAPQIGW